MKICIVLSTRPEIIKLSPLIEKFKEKKINYYLVNTNQHSLKKMSKIFFNFFDIKDKIHNIYPPKKDQHEFLSYSIKKIGSFLKKNKPNYLLVQGDTNTSLAGCLSAALVNRSLKKKIKIIHVEAGLRSFDDTMPEEVNRKLIDRISDILFVPTKFDYNNLIKENCLINKKVFITGNTVTDVLKKYLPLCSNSKILSKLKITQNKYFLITMHRPESVDNEENLKKLDLILNKIIEKYNYPIIFPIHPRTKFMIKKFKIRLNKKIKIIDPLEYLDFLKLIKNTKLLFTDSGGLQEETAILGTPCVTLRTTTERQITVIKKVNFIAGYDYNKVFKAINFFLNKRNKSIKDFGRGNVSNKILSVIKKDYLV